MTSEELIDLLYVAYNRDEAEVFGINKALHSGYEELYTTAPDVLDKKMKELDTQIERQALELINEKVLQVRSKKQREIEEKEARFGEIIRRRAEAILRQNASYIGKETSEEAIEMIQEEATSNNVESASFRPQEEKEKPKQTKRGRPRKNIETKEEGGHINVEEEKKAKKRGRKPKLTN